MDKWWKSTRVISEGGISTEVITSAVSGCLEVWKGEGEVVETDESNFGRRNFNRVYHVSGRSLFGVVVKGSNNTFLVAGRTVLMGHVSQSRVRQR